MLYIYFMVLSFNPTFCTITCVSNVFFFLMWRYLYCFIFSFPYINFRNFFVALYWMDLAYTLDSIQNFD